MAMIWYLRAAEQGHMVAQFKVAKAYEEGSDGVSQYHTQASQWFLKAAEQGHGEAQVALGDRYRKGRGLHRNSRIAMDWYLKAAEQKDHAQAQFKIGLMYLQHKYFEQALHLDQGDGDSVQDNNNGGPKQDGDHGIPKDEDKALHWFLKASHQGLADAQFAVTYLLLRAYNPKDASSSSAFTIAEWCRKAADQNHAPAQIYMGFLYRSGIGVPVDRTLASEWLHKAVGRSGGWAELNLYLYAEHHGVPPDGSTVRE